MSGGRVKFLVCVKQVPQVDQVRFDRANRIVREDVDNLCNPLDLQALGHALRLRAPEDEVIVATMGPPTARAVLEDGLARGANRAIQLTDRRFQGADTLATARALAEVVRRESPDLVLSGRSTLDGATAQLGQQVAELAELGLVTEAVGISLLTDGVHIERETDHGYETWQAPLPVLLTIARGPQPREPFRQSSADVVELSAEDLSGTPTEYGTRGSPTFVRQVRTREIARGRELIESVETAAARVRSLLAEPEGQARSVSSRQERASGNHDVWVLAERDRNTLDPISFEGLACADRLAAELGARVTAILLDAADDAAARELTERGADRVLHVHHPRLRVGSARAYADALATVLTREQPLVLVAPWTVHGRDYVPQVAARLGLGLIGDVTGVEVELGEKPRIQWIKPAWAGTAEALVISRTTPTVATLRPGSYTPLPRRAVSAVDVVNIDGTLAAVSNEPRLVSHRHEVDARVLDRAPVVFCVGSQVLSATVAQLRELAEAWGVGVGGTAEAVRLGLVPPQWELGLLKRSIAPAVCVVLGVRQAQEVAAVRAASMLVTVHPEADMPVHDCADLQVATEVEPFVKALAAQHA